MTLLAEWKNNTVAIILADLPGHDYDSALTLVDAQLVAAGGWVLEGGEPAGGNGAPNDGSTPAQAAATIRTNELAKTNTLTVEVDVTLKMLASGAYSVGTSAADILASLDEDLETRIEGRLPSGVTAETYDWDNASSSTRAGGTLDQSARQGVDTEIDSGTLQDPAAIATKAARDEFSLDDKWVASELYVPTAGTCYVTVTLYTNNTYDVVDGTATFKIIVCIDAKNSTIRALSKVLL